MMSQDELQKILDVIAKSGIKVEGDLVAQKHVECEFKNFGTIAGDVVLAGKQDERKPLTISDKCIKEVIEELLKEKVDENELLFRNKKQWWAIYKVLLQFCNYPSQMKAFETKMMELEVAKVDGKRDLSYESLSAAPKEVPLLATCSPSAWNTLKDKNENYKQQYLVAEFLMVKMGIKS